MGLTLIRKSDGRRRKKKPKIALVLAGGAFRVLTDHSPAAAKRLFGTSIVYLFALFALLLVDRAWPVPLLP